MASKRTIESSRLISIIIIFLFLLTMPFMSNASELIHTIQTGSFGSEHDAQRHYDSVMQKLNENERDHLRIEKIGGHYAVRFGKFDSYSEIRNIIPSVKKKFAAVLVVKAYIKDERIVRMYASKPVKEENAAVSPAKEEAPKIAESKRTKESAIEEAKNDADTAPADPVKKKTAVRSDVCSPEAIDACRKDVKANPDMAGAYYNLGAAYSKTGMYKHAIEVYKKGIALNPNFPQAHYNLGIAYIKTGMYENAVNVFKKAVSLKPDFDKAHYNLGTAYSKSGKHEDAIKAYKKAVDLNPKYTKAHYNLGTAYIKSGMFKDAIDAFQKTINMDPQFAKAHYNLGTAYSKTGMYEDAIEAYKKGIDLNPDFATHDNLKIAYIKSGMNKYAVDDR